MYSYDLYGRGFSDRPDLKYDEKLFASQLGDFLKQKKLDRFHLTGVSMGGAISVYFANRHAARIQSHIPRLKLLSVDSCGNTPQYEKQETVNPALIEFLKSE